MKRLCSHLWYAVVLATVSFTIVFAVVITLVRGLTPFVNDHRLEVEQWVSKLISQPVQIDTFKVTWHRFTPVLQGKQVTIWNDSHTHPLLKVDELDVGISIISSLFSGQIKFGEIKVSGMQLEAHQNKENKITFSGISALFPQTLDDDSGITEVVDWVLSEPMLTLENTTVTFFDKTGKMWSPVKFNLILKNNGNFHQLRGIANIIQAIPTQISFMAEVEGQWAQKEKLTAKLYVAGEQVLLTQWLKDYARNQLAIKSGISDFEVWADWNNNQITQIQTELTVKNLVLADASSKKTTLIYFAPLSVNLFWQKVQDKWVVDAITQQLGFTRWNAVPGIKGLNAYLHLTPDNGLAVINSQITQLDFGKMFKAPLNFDHLTMQAAWHKDDAGWNIDVTSFKADSQNLQLNGEMEVLLPADNSSPELNILTSFRINNAKSVPYYLPLTVLKPNLVRWLSNSIKKTQTEGTFILQGKADEFPYDENNGTFLIDANVNNMTLEYDPDWPPLEQFDGELIFAGRRMDIDIPKGVIFGIPVQNVHAEIPNIKKNVQAVLHINVDKIDSTLQKGLTFLANSPLQDGIAGNLRGLDVQGPMQLQQLQITIPLEDGLQKTDVFGRVDISKVQLKIPSRDVWLRDLQGQFTFTQDGVEAQGLAAILWDKPIKIDIKSKPKTQLTLNYKDTQTYLLPQKNGWVLAVRNPNAKGEIFIPHAKQQPLNANFKYLYFNPNQTTDMQWEPTKIPALNFNVDEIRYGDINLGNVIVRLSPMLGGSAIRQLQMKTAGSTLDASGSWRQLARGTHTQLSGQLDTPDVSALLKNWGLSPSIQAKNGNISFDLNWFGAPYDPDLNRINGKFSMHLHDGQIIDIGESAEAKVSFGHLLTSLSLQTIGKRLRLDFSDLNTKGFDFNILKGDFTLQNGNAITNNALIDGPVALINIRGRIGLANKDYDLTIGITPHFTSSLPVIAALAGGPIIGLTALMANTLLGSQVQKIATTTYHMTGPWSKPDVKEVAQHYAQ